MLAFDRMQETVSVKWGQYRLTRAKRKKEKNWHHWRDKFKTKTVPIHQTDVLYRGLILGIKLHFDDIKGTEQHINASNNLVLKHAGLYVLVSYAHCRNFDLPALMKRSAWLRRLLWD